MTRVSLALVLVASAALSPACGDDAPAGGGSDTGLTIDTGLPGGDVGADTAAPTCTSGIDEDGDGVCDRLAADWSATATLPLGGNRADIYGLGEHLPDVATRGLGHALVWPVDVSGVLLPWPPLERLLDPDPDPEMEQAELDKLLGMQDLFRRALGFGTTDEMFEWLGLARFDGQSLAMPGAGIAWPDSLEQGTSMGFGVIPVEGGEAMTFSCATCHTANLFGRTVAGLTNRQAQANEFFHLAKDFFPTVTPAFFASIAEIADGEEVTDGETAMFARTQENLGAVNTRAPQVRGLDTSLAQVSLSLSRRAEDEYATRDPAFERRPRPNDLSSFVADSKPAVWWTLKYKTRWLADGSIVSGNPVFTNFLWNEIGRGTDLRELEAWLEENQHVVDELTVAVFATEAPRWVDWFGEETLDEEAARRGYVTFEAVCSTCHGSYDMAWDEPGADAWPVRDRVRPTRLNYHARTPVEDVGTDPQRAQGMATFAERLNELAISEWMGTVVEVQGGYVPPPLDGIWSRYPYLHNHSVPTLCEMLLPSEMRTDVFWMGPSDDPDTDFDADCVGFPVGDAVPESWKEVDRAEFDTSRPGLSNQGHDEWLRDDDGQPLLSDAERADLVEFLKTL